MRVFLITLGVSIFLIPAGCNRGPNTTGVSPRPDAATTDTTTTVSTTAASWDLTVDELTRPLPAPPGFESPVRLTAAGELISVDRPGYACPTVADVDGDGVEDLIVGQFANGSMRFFRNIAPADAAPEYAAEQWITSNGEPAVVPGVW